MGKLFGTDGIRGVAGQYPINTEMAERIGAATAMVFGKLKETTVVVGRDPRISGLELKSSLITGCYNSGLNVLDADILPTPGISYLTSALKASVGIVISASHNPYEDNGFKFFDQNGFKLSEELENQLESAILDSEMPWKPKFVGTVQAIPDGADRYKTFLMNTWPIDLNLKGIHIVVDGSNGATSAIAPLLFEATGARVTPIFCDPNGININDGCGSEHTKALSNKVVALKADIGFAFDGDGDRLVAVDETGGTLSGDQILAVLANDLNQRGKLRPKILVSTVMSNVGLTSALKKMGIDHVKAGVGDRLVMEKMKELGAVLGGEDSGHMIFLNHHSTGDGMLSALRLLETFGRSKSKLSQLGQIIVPMPQSLINVPVQSKPPLSQLASVSAEIQAIENLLGDSGRVLVRYSGTQSICRVMVEGPTSETTNRYCMQLAACIQKEIG
jgi:phosphoglucosamine mutase